MKVALISCGKNKQQGVFAAKDLYQSARFQKCIKLAETQYDLYFILSALHGLVHPEEPLQTYDVTMKNLSKEGKADWNMRVARDLRKYVTQGAELHFLAGSAYSRGLQAELEKDYKLCYPLAGMKPGFVLQWLNKQLNGNA